MKYVIQSTMHQADCWVQLFWMRVVTHTPHLHHRGADAWTGLQSIQISHGHCTAEAPHTDQLRWGGTFPPRTQSRACPYCVYVPVQVCVVSRGGSPVHASHLRTSTWRMPVRHLTYCLSESASTLWWCRWTAGAVCRLSRSRTLAAPGPSRWGLGVEEGF